MERLTRLIRERERVVTAFSLGNYFQERKK